MAKIALLFAFMVVVAIAVEGRDWRFEAARRVKRGYNSGYGTSGDGYGGNEDNASSSRERLGCSEEQRGGSYGSGSHELGYNRNDRSNDNRRHRSFTKSSSSASAVATASNQHPKTI